MHNNSACGVIVGAPLGALGNGACWPPLSRPRAVSQPASQPASQRAALSPAAFPSRASLAAPHRAVPVRAQVQARIQIQIQIPMQAQLAAERRRRKRNWTPPPPPAGCVTHVSRRRQARAGEANCYARRMTQPAELAPHQEGERGKPRPRPGPHRSPSKRESTFAPKARFHWHNNGAFAAALHHEPC